ncbi:reverse transcriptase domain-containing protein [Tanacetum coccineum]
MEKMSSGANNGAKPLKSILKITRPKGAAGDTIDVAGAGKNKKDGVGIQPFKVAMPVKDVNEANKSTGFDHVYEFIHTEGIQQVDTNGNPNVADADLCQVRCDGDHVYGSPCNEGIKSFANLFNDMGHVMDSNEARSDWELKIHIRLIRSRTSIRLTNMAAKTTADANDDQSHVPSKKLNFWSFVNDEKVENSDIVLPRDAIDKGKFGLQKSMRNDDGIFLLKFADKRGMKQVLERGPWLILNTLLILNKWTSSLPLRKDKVTKGPVWVKLHKVSLVAYSEDGLSLIATQIGKPLILDAFTSTMCVEAWGRISFAHALVEISSDTDLKKEPRRYADCKTFGHSCDKCPKIFREPVTCTTPDMNSDGFTEVERNKNKVKKADQQPRYRHIHGIRLTKPKSNFYWQKTGTNKSGVDLVNKGLADANSSNNKVNGPSTSNSFDILNNVDEGDACGVSSSMGNQEKDQVVEHATVSKHTSPTWNEDFESDDEVDEVVFPKGNKFDDQFDIRLKGRVKK